MRYAIMASLALIAASGAQAAEKTVTSSLSFALSDSLVLNQSTLFSDLYFDGLQLGTTGYRGTVSQQPVSELVFGGFDSALGTLTKATLTVESAIVTDMGFSQVISDPAFASFFVFAPSFNAALTGHGVAQEHDDPGEQLSCIVNADRPSCLLLLEDRPGSVNFAQDLDLASAADGYDFDLTRRSGISWFALIVGSPTTTALVSSEWTGEAVLTYTYLERAVVPEPATWAMMVAGFGAAGVAVRRRGRLVIA